MRRNSGISLIVLVITIIVILILAGTVILSLSSNNLIGQATAAKFKSDAQEINSELQLWISSKYLDARGGFNPATVNVDNLNKKYEGQTISQILTTLKGDNVNKFQIAGGKLVYVGNSIEESNWMKDIGISQDLPYTKDGLVLWYDGINNGGIGIHNDNTSDGKSTWIDLSDNGNNMEIYGTDFTLSDGWNTNSLKLDGTSHTMSSNNPLKDQTLTSQSYTIEVIFKKNSIGLHRYILGINNGFYPTYSSSEQGLIYINDGTNSNDFYSYSKNTSTIDTIMSYAGTYVKNSTINTVELYTNASDVITNNDNWYSTDLKEPYGMDTDINYSAFVDANIYAIRIYDRVLTPEEIKNNFDLDKLRFGIL